MLKNITCFLSSLIDIIDSDGGHLVLLVVLTIMFQRYQAEAYLDLTIGALLMKLKDAGSNKNREVKYAPSGSSTVLSETIDTKPENK